MADAMDFNNECCLCLQIFTDPRVLPCLHTFCLKCLENILATIPNDEELCPVCESKFIVPEDGLPGLPRNICAEKLPHVRTTSTFKPAARPSTSCDACVTFDLRGKTVAEKYCINCEDKLCLKCCGEHEKRKEHLIVDLSCQTENKDEETQACRCHVHQEEVPNIYCTFCRKVICKKCFHESHRSHNCIFITDDAVGLVCKQAEKEYNNAEDMQQKFQVKRDTIHREQMKFLEKVKRMETEVLKRCEEIKELVVKETKTLLQELAVLKMERLEEIEMEHRRIDKHIFTLDKFKEYCAWIKSNSALNYACEAESILRNTADELRIHVKSSIESRIFPIQFEFQKTDVREFWLPISNAIGKLNVTYPYKMELSTAIDTNQKILHGLTSLQDRLYLLSDSILIHRAENPYDRIGKIQIREIKSPASIMSCSQTSRLYIYDKENSCIWTVSIPDHRVTRWLEKVQGPCAMSVSPNGEILIATQSTGTEKSVKVELYSQNAILTERLELPISIQSLKGLYKTQSGNYIGFGDKDLYKFRADGSTVCQSDMTKYPGIGNYVQCLEVSPYHVFLFSTRNNSACSFKVSLITSSLTFHSSLIENTKQMAIGACYVKATKRLAVLEHFQTRVYVSSGKSNFPVPNDVTEHAVTVYNVL